LERGKGIREEEKFMWRGKKREVRKAGIDGKEFSRKYGGGVPETVVSDDAINGECVACFGS